MHIRDERLYREHHGTFEEYCQKRWQMARSRAYQLIEGAKTVKVLSTMVDKPESERVVRPLAGLEPAEQREVWKSATEKAPVILLFGAFFL
jgi:hypothetical protein